MVVKMQVWEGKRSREVQCSAGGGGGEGHTGADRGVRGQRGDEGTGMMWSKAESWRSASSYLWALGGADVGQHKLPVRLLRVAHPAGACRGKHGQWQGSPPAQLFLLQLPPPATCSLTRAPQLAGC